MPVTCHNKSANLSYLLRQAKTITSEKSGNVDDNLREDDKRKHSEQA